MSMISEANVKKSNRWFVGGDFNESPNDSSFAQLVDTGGKLSEIDSNGKPEIDVFGKQIDFFFRFVPPFFTEALAAHCPLFLRESLAAFSGLCVLGRACPPVLLFAFAADRGPVFCAPRSRHKACFFWSGFCVCSPGLCMELGRVFLPCVALRPSTAFELLASGYVARARIFSMAFFCFVHNRGKCKHA